MTKKRSHGLGTIQARGGNSFRLRYRVDGKRFTETFRGLKSEAQKRLTALIAAGDAGDHIAPDRITMTQWLPRWTALIERKADGDATTGRNRGRLVNSRTLERYEELLRLHVLPTLGSLPLHKIRGTQIDDLYSALEQRLAPRTVHHVHTVLKACLNMAVRKGLLGSNPAEKAEAPSPGESDHGMALDEHQLTALVQGFKGTALYPIVAVAAFTGARRNEILALRWSDLSVEDKTLTIARAVEETKKHGRGTKEPKTARGLRTIAIDDSLVELLRVEQEQHRRRVAGVPDGTAVVDLSLVRLPDDALMFPGGYGSDLTKLRDAHAVSRNFVHRARALGFPKLRFHDLRGSHETLLLDKGVPVHVVAARCGHDPAVLLRTYAKRTKKADTTAAQLIGSLSRRVLFSE
jgi:integrase